MLSSFISGIFKPASVICGMGSTPETCSTDKRFSGNTPQPTAPGDLVLVDHSASSMLRTFSGTGYAYNGQRVKVKAGVPSDADFTDPQDGLQCFDSNNNRLYVRLGGLWKYAALT